MAFIAISLQILTRVLQKCFLSSPLPNVLFLSKPLHLIGCHGNRKAEFAKNMFFKNLRSHKGDKAKTLQKRL